MSQVLVTGANGFLGQWLCQALVNESHQVTALVRKPEACAFLEKIGCSLVAGDVTDLGSLQRSFQNKEAIFHLAGLIAYKRSDRAAMEQVNVLGTEKVLQAACKQKVGRLIHLSSVVAVGASENSEGVLNEDSPYNLKKYDFGYFETKRNAETLVLSESQRGNLDAVCVNPSTIYGAGDATKGSRKTQMKVAQGRFPFYTAGGVSVVAVEDVTKGILSAWKKGKSGERYILSGENLTIKELFSLISKSAGVPPPRIRIPSLALSTLGHLGDLLTQIGISSSLSYENAKVATLFHWFDHSKATRELDFHPRPAKEAIEASVNWMRENGFLVGNKALFKTP